MAFQFTVCCGPAAAQTASPVPRSAAAIAYDKNGNLFIADALGNQVWEATVGGKLVLIAGKGTQGFAGDGGSAVLAELDGPEGLAVGADGSVYVADTGNARIRAITAAGQITTFAGTGAVGFGGDGGGAASAAFRRPTALALDAAGTLYVCDSTNHRVRSIRDGTIQTVAGSGREGFAGDGAPATQAELDTPSGLAVRDDGTIFVSDTQNQRVRVISSDGSISTVAGSGVRGFAGDGGFAPLARLASPQGLAIDAHGELWIADTGNHRVRGLDTSGKIATLVGVGNQGSSMDGTPALGAVLDSPQALAASAQGFLAFSEAGNHTVRVAVTTGGLYRPSALASGRISTLAVPPVASVIYGQGSLQASVSGSVGVPGGVLHVNDGGAIAYAAELSAGVASINTSALSAGEHGLQLQYMGDGLNPASQAEPLQVTVAPAPVVATADSASVAYGQAMPSLTGTTSGVFDRDAASVSTVFASQGGAMPVPGSYPIEATLTGERAGNYALTVSPSSGHLIVVKAGCNSALIAPARVYAGLPAAFTASVHAIYGGQPTGMVQLLSGGVVVGSAPLVNGIATFNSTFQTAGTAQLAAAYSGDANFLPAVSTSVALALAALPDFKLLSGSAQNASAVQGRVAQYGFQVQSVSEAFTGAVSFSVSGLPAGASASFSPPQVVPGSETASVTISIQTATSTLTGQKRVPEGNTGMRVFFGAVVSALTWSRRRGKRIASLGLVCLFGLSGCGARSVKEGVEGVLSQTYSLQLTATATNLAGAVVTHVMPFTLTITQ